MQTILKNNVKWGVIGAGRVCEVKSAPAMQIIPNSQITAVMRRDEELAKDYANRHGIEKWYNNVDLLINDPDVNAIYIATPPESHAELCLKAAKAGKPVYVEKPMARTHHEALMMVEACRAANVPLFVAYYRRALPTFLRIKELIEQGTIGDVRFVNIQMVKPLDSSINNPATSNWRVFPEMAGGGHFYDLASHQLDYLDFLFGPITKVYGYAANQAKLYKAEDIVSGTFEFENGIIGNGIWCFTSSLGSEKDFTQIVGTKGQIDYQTFGDPNIYITNEQGKKSVQEFEFPKHIQEPLIKLVVDELLGKGVCPSTGSSGARTNWVLEQFTKKYYF
jgi:predicted dehydrogenase